MTDFLLLSERHLSMSVIASSYSRRIITLPVDEKIFGRQHVYSFRNLDALDRVVIARDRLLVKDMLRVLVLPQITPEWQQYFRNRRRRMHALSLGRPRLWIWYIW